MKYRKSAMGIQKGDGISGCGGEDLERLYVKREIWFELGWLRWYMDIPMNKIVSPSVSSSAFGLCSVVHTTKCQEQTSLDNS